MFKLSAAHAASFSATAVSVAKEITFFGVLK